MRPLPEAHAPRPPPSPPPNSSSPRPIPSLGIGIVPRVSAGAAKASPTEAVATPHPAALLTSLPGVTAGDLSQLDQVLRQTKAEKKAKAAVKVGRSVGRGRRGGRRRRCWGGGMQGGCAMHVAPVRDRRGARPAT